MSPSHTVGLEQGFQRLKRSPEVLHVIIPHSGLKTLIAVVVPIKQEVSASHPGGLEQRYLAWEVGTGKTISPSHTVGLELS
jgi:hypothetical protein